MEDEAKEQAVEDQGQAEQAGALVPVGEMAASQIAAAREAAIAYAVDVVEYCGLAGLPAKAADFIRRGVGIEDVRKELTAARAAADSEERIHSHVLPEDGTESGKPGATDVSKSPIVQAAERLAAEGKEKR